jgi:catechol 2,3-dioxygenase-like lactoylglutathione lyase family enzyme
MLAISRSVKWCLKNRMSTVTTTAINASTYSTTPTCLAMASFYTMVWGNENAYRGDARSIRREEEPVSHVRRFDHVGLTVADLDVVTAFFVALGLEVEGRTFVEGEFLDTVCGIPGSRTEIVMLKPPGDGTRLELSSFVRPGSVPGSPDAMANELGLRNVAFEVNDLQAAVDWAAAEGYGLVGGIGEYEGAWRMAYVRGPEGIIVALAERIG